MATTVEGINVMKSMLPLPIYWEVLASSVCYYTEEKSSFIEREQYVILKKELRDGGIDILDTSDTLANPTPDRWFNKCDYMNVKDGNTFFWYKKKYARVYDESYVESIADYRRLYRFGSNSFPASLKKVTIDRFMSWLRKKTTLKHNGREMPYGKYMFLHLLEVVREYNEYKNLGLLPYTPVLEKFAAAYSTVIRTNKINYKIDLVNLTYSIFEYQGKDYKKYIKQMK